MSTIRYTRHGDYAANSHRFKTRDLGSPIEGFFPVSTINSRSSDKTIQHTQPRSTPPRSDGVFADLSDNTKTVDLRGGDKGDVLIAGAGQDYIKGESGDDVIIGVLGSDTLIGGSGSDTYVFQTVDDSKVTSVDVVQEFSGAGGDGDRIDLTAIANFTFIGADNFDADGTAQLQAIPRGRSYNLFGDADGDGQADFAIKVFTDSPLTASDFVSGNSLPSHDGFPSGAHLTGHPAFAEPLHSLAHLALA